MKLINAITDFISFYFLFFFFLIYVYWSWIIWKLQSLEQDIFIELKMYSF